MNPNFYLPPDSITAYYAEPVKRVKPNKREVVLYLQWRPFPPQVPRRLFPEKRKILWKIGGKYCMIENRTRVFSGFVRLSRIFPNPLYSGGVQGCGASFIPPEKWSNYEYPLVCGAADPLWAQRDAD